MLNNLRNNRYRLQNSAYMTIGILVLTILLYILTTIDGGSQNPFTLVKYGAKVNELIYMGDWWRLISPMFLHIGFTHLLFNGIIIYFLGSQLELIIGHWRFLNLYLLSGILGNAASFALTNSISAGASTAVFGLFASTIVLGKIYPYHNAIQRLSRNYFVLIILNVVMGFFSPTIDNAGHIGGLLGGYLIMYVLSSRNAMNNPIKKRIYCVVGYVAALVILIAIGMIRVSRDLNFNFFIY